MQDSQQSPQTIRSVSANFKKRKLDNVVTETKVCTEKKMMMNKGVVVLQEVEEKSKITEENNEMKNKAKKRTENGLYSCSCTERPSHSTAERARREKISERMKSSSFSSWMRQDHWQSRDA
ncbi:hypothetical protein Bca4012_055185 [Brassica carinata]